MMSHSTSLHTSSTIRFTKWSHKAYASFVSLGRCVTIGTLSNGILDAAIRKNKSTAPTEHTTSILQTSEEEERREITPTLDNRSIITTKITNNTDAAAQAAPHVTLIHQEVSLKETSFLYPKTKTYDSTC